MSGGLKFFVWLILVIIMGVGFLLFYYQPKFKEIADLSATNKELQTTLEKDKAAIAEKDKYEADVKQLQSELESVQKTVNMEDFVPTLYEDMEDLVTASSIAKGDPKFRILSISISEPTAPSEGGGKEGAAYVVYPIRIETEGYLSTLEEFYNSLSDSKRCKQLITVGGLSIGVKDPAKGILGFTVPLQSYAFPGTASKSQ